MAGYNFQGSDPAEYLSGIVGGPVTLTSGLRSPQRNAQVGGVPNSAHLVPGQAYDFVPKGISTSEAANRLAKSGISFDQVYDEGDHVHVSFAPTNRRQVIPPKMAQSGPSDDDILAALTGKTPAVKAAPATGGDFPPGDSRNSPAAVTVGGSGPSDDEILAALTGGGKGSPAPAGAPKSAPGASIQPSKKWDPAEGFSLNMGVPFLQDIHAGLNAGGQVIGNALAGNSGPSFGQAYQQNMQELTQLKNDYAGANPGPAQAAQMAGLITTMGGSGGMAAGRAVAPTLGALIKGGAKTGAAYGTMFGAGQPDQDNTAMGRVENAGTGGLIGALTGGTLPVLSKVVAPVGKALGATLGALGEKTGLLTPDYQAKAKNMLLRALERDQTPAGDIATGLSGSEGKPLTAMDLAGTNVKRQARNLITQPGEAGDTVTKFLGERAENQSGRVLGDIKSHLSSNTDVYGVGERLADERSKTSAPLWKEAMDRPAVTTDRLKDFAADPDIKSGMKEGITLARREALAKGEKFDPNAYAITEFDAAGDPKIGPVPTWRTWQAAKEGLDQRIESFRDPVTGRLPNTKAVNSLVNLKTSLVNELDKVNPAYKEARAAWAGPSAAKSALNMGGDFLKADPEEIVKAMSGMTESERDFYRIGAARAMQDRANAASDSSDLSKRLFGNARIRSQIETVFGKGAAEKFGNAMGSEAGMAHTNRFVLGGPNTANKFADAEDSHLELAQDLMHGFMHGGPKGAATLGTYGALKRGVNNLFNGVHPVVANHLASALTASGQSAVHLYDQLAAEQAARNTQALGRHHMGQGINRLAAAVAAQNAVRGNPQ